MFFSDISRPFFSIDTPVDHRDQTFRALLSLRTTFSLALESKNIWSRLLIIASVITNKETVDLLRANRFVFQLQLQTSHPTISSEMNLLKARDESRYRDCHVHKTIIFLYGISIRLIACSCSYHLALMRRFSYQTTLFMRFDFSLTPIYQNRPLIVDQIHYATLCFWRHQRLNLN
jgi:hypothetical protein